MSFKAKRIMYSDIHVGMLVQVTGVCVSIKGHPRLRRVRGEVASIIRPGGDGPTLFKLWPDKTIDDGKLWFCGECSKVERLMPFRSRAVSFETWVLWVRVHT